LRAVRCSSSPCCKASLQPRAQNCTRWRQRFSWRTTSSWA
jgi:hypothetical protein